MNEPQQQPIEAELMPQEQSLTKVEQRGMEVGRPLSVNDVMGRLKFVRQVMAEAMKEGEDYGKIPGVDKPSLLQPGAQKLALTFQLTPKIREERVVDYPNYHREYSFTIQVGGATDGVGTCSTLEAKYRYRPASRKCPECGKYTIIAGKEEYGGGWLCFKKKGGCGAKFEYKDQRIQSQPSDKVEHDNPADYWNTVRKMAFKRGFVHAIINATNTSELWTQDVEDAPSDDAKAPQSDSEVPQPQRPNRPVKTPPKAKSDAKKFVAVPAARLDALLKASKDKMLAKLAEIQSTALQYFVETRLILDTEALEDVDAKQLFKSINSADTYEQNIQHIKKDFEHHYQAICKLAGVKPQPNGGKQLPITPWPKGKPPPNIEVPTGEVGEWWRDVQIHFGQAKGTRLEDLGTKQIFGWAMNWQPQPFNGKVSDIDARLRRALDCAKDHYGFKEME